MKMCQEKSLWHGRGDSKVNGEHIEKGVDNMIDEAFLGIHQIQYWWLRVGGGYGKVFYKKPSWPGQDKIDSCTSSFEQLKLYHRHGKDWTMGLRIN